MSTQGAATLLSLVADEADRDLSRRGLERSEIISTAQNGRDQQIADTAAERLVACWHHAHRFDNALRAVGGDPAGLTTWFKERASQSIDGLFDLEGRNEEDLASPRMVRPTRFIVGALQYATAGTPLLDGQESVLALLQSELTLSSGEARLPHFDLLRDLARHADRLGTWLQPEREPNGTVRLGSLTVVDEGRTPVALCSKALDGLESDPANEGSWLSLEIVRGTDPLTDSEARRFEKATDDLDIPGLLEELEGVAALAAHRLARQALVANDSERQRRLRDSLRAVEEVRDGEDTSSAFNSTSRPAGELSEVQRAVVEGLYLLAQAGPTPADATALFAEDLSALSRMNPSYLGQVRGLLERLVVERPISEAQAFLGLLVRARGM